MQQVENCLLIAEANRVLCHLPMFLTAFFSLDLQNEIQLLSACYQDSSVILGCFFFLRFWLRNAPLVKKSSEIIVFKNNLHLAGRVGGL